MTRAATGGIADSGRSAGRSTGPRLRPTQGVTAGATPSTAVACRAVQVVVVVPTYNEADNIADAVSTGPRKAVPGCRRADRRRRQPRRHGRRRPGAGRRASAASTCSSARQGAASGRRTATGFRRAIDGGADVCVQIDADLSHDPADLPALVANVEHGADLAIGSRYVPGGLHGGLAVAAARALSRWGNRYAAGVLGLAVNDATAGYRAYSADVARGDGLRGGRRRRLRLPGRDDPPPGARRRPDRRVPDRRSATARAGESKLSKGIVGEALGLVLRALGRRPPRPPQRRRGDGG